MNPAAPHAVQRLDRSASADYFAATALAAAAGVYARNPQGSPASGSDPRSSTKSQRLLLHKKLGRERFDGLHEQPGGTGVTKMKLLRVYSGPDRESHIERLEFAFAERRGTLTQLQKASGVSFGQRTEGSFSDFHNAPHHQYVLYLTASVELGLGDGSSVVMEPGDVLRAEDTTGRGHTSRVLIGGMVAIVPLADE